MSADLPTKLRRTIPALSGEVVRYGLTGAVVALTYLGGAYLLASAGLPVYAAIAISYPTAVVLHFVAQRSFVFRGNQFQLSMRQQLVRYVGVGSAQLVLTYGGTAVLVSLGVDQFAAFLATTVIATAALFLTLRRGVFHAGKAP